MTNLSWRAAAVTDRGLKRMENQDNYFVSADDRVFAVADGMGGARDGSVASRLAIETVKQRWDNSKPEHLVSGITQDWLVDTVAEANHTIYSVAGDDDSPRRMGTTLVIAAQTEDGKMEIAHVGDSRAYLVRRGKANSITFDHSVVMDMYLKKQLTKKQAEDSIYRSLLTRCLGHNNEIEIDKNVIEPKPGDWIVLCSDGLNSELDDEEIAKLVGLSQTPDEACEKLLEATKAHGANDNVTIVAIHYFDESKRRR